ncbi:MAG TPA: 50S ribosomal protein L29 [Candidatus Binatia bacterium]|jgi:large subunit ribosomal protein L29|nr:50S ribosomal protein L29 [Candidatus Binatia bacterium]
MEVKEMRDMSMDELIQKRGELRESIFNLKLKRATSRLESPMKLREARKDLARIETILTERELQGARG